MKTEKQIKTEKLLDKIWQIENEACFCCNLKEMDKLNDKMNKTKKELIDLLKTI